MKYTLPILSILFVTGCSTFYYGYLPGSDYPIYASRVVEDLNGRDFDIDLVDNRNQKTTAECADFKLDRDSELEGELGIKLATQYLTSTILQSHGKINLRSGASIKLSVEAISFLISGIGIVTVKGVVQIRMTRDGFEKVYCSNLKDGDELSPVKTFSWDSRTGASRKMVSAALRVVMDNILQDLGN